MIIYKFVFNDNINTIKGKISTLDKPSLNTLTNDDVARGKVFLGSVKNSSVRIMKYTSSRFTTSSSNFNGKIKEYGYKCILTGFFGMPFKYSFILFIILLLPILLDFSIRALLFMGCFLSTSHLISAIFPSKSKDEIISFIQTDLGGELVK